MQENQLICVVGGTGTLGRPVVRQLLESGYRVRVLTTRPGKATGIFGGYIEEAEGDVSDPVSLERAFAGCYGVHINLMGGPGREGCFRIEAQGTHNVVAACRKAGVRKITYLSGMAVSGLTPDQANDPHYFNFPAVAKYQAEQAIRSSGIAWTIFRPTNFVDTFEKYIRGRVAVLFGGFSGSCHWMNASDYARYVVQAYQNPVTDGKVYPLLGTEALPYGQAKRLYFSLARPDVFIVTVPFWLLRAVSVVAFSAALKAGLRLMKAAGDFLEDSAEVTFRELGPPQLTLQAYCRHLHQQQNHAWLQTL